MPQQKREYIQALNKQKNNIIDDIKTKVTSEFATTAFTLSSLEDLCFFILKLSLFCQNQPWWMSVGGDLGQLIVSAVGVAPHLKRNTIMYQNYMYANT